LKRMAGGGVIEVRPERADQLVLTAEALGRLGGGSPQIEEATRSVTVGVEGSGSLPSAVKALDAAGIRIEDMALRQPTLDEVFLALTGRSATETRDDSRPTLAAA